MYTLTIEISPQLHQMLLQFVSEGWFKTLDGLVEEALQRYLESPSLEMMTPFIQKDIKWGLSGNE